MKEKSSKLLIIITIILLILVISMGVYIWYNNDSNKKTVNHSENGKSYESSIKVINFDKKKCINNDFSNNTINKILLSADANGLSFSIDSTDEKVVKVQANYNTMFPGKYSEEQIINNSVKYLEDIDLKLDKKVESMFFGIFSGDHVNGGVFLFLLDDGSLEYMKYSDVYNSQNYELHKISGVSKIVKLDNIAITPEDGVGAKYTAIAYKIDGTYYDLSKFIEL